MLKSEVTDPPAPGDDTPRRYTRRKGVEKDWRKGGDRWRYDEHEEEGERDSTTRGRSAPRKFRLSTPENERIALVIQTGGPDVLLLDGEEELRAQPRRSTTSENGDATLLAIGDRVRYTSSGEGDAIITHVFERHSALSRTAVRARDFQQVLAANVDFVVVVTAATRELLRPGLVDRYLVAAAMGGMRGMVCINKMDLVDDEDQPLIDDIVKMYNDAGYDVVCTSCETGEGIDTLSDLLGESISVFSGHSGVGKTSLLNVLLPGLDEETQELSEQSQRGAHTTTRSTLFELPSGGWIADTPGIREFGLFNFDKADLHTYYPEFVAVADQCHFPSCTHDHEPDCAVIRAVEEERIHPTRYRNYLQILASEQGES